MNRNYLILGLSCLLTFAACERTDPDNPKPKPEPGPEIPEGMVSTKTLVGLFREGAAMEADGSSVFSAAWTKADVIYATTATGAEGETPTLTAFTLVGEDGGSEGVFESETAIIGNTFSAVYSSTMANFTEDNSHIEVVFPSVQEYVENGLAPHLIPMYAVGTDTTAMTFNYGSGVLRLNLWSEYNETVTKIEVITDVPASGTMLASPADPKFPCGYVAGETAATGLNNVVVKGGAPEYVTTYNIPGGVVLGATAETATQFNIALAASTHCGDVTVGEEAFPAYRKLAVRIYSDKGMVIAKASENFRVKAGEVHVFPDFNVVKMPEAPVVELQGSSSSTLSFRWTSKTLTDHTRPYKVALYKDEACTDLFASWDLAANDPAYRDGDDWYQTAFVFSGLAANTSYWCKVTDVADDLTSEAVAGTTADFTSVAVSETKVDAAGAVLLAEDFSELVWGGDVMEGSIGYKADALVNCAADITLFGDWAEAAKTSRLKDWAHITSAASGAKIYALPGYARLSDGSDWTRILTPVLSNLGDISTVTVSFKAAPYYEGDKADGLNCCVEVITDASAPAADGTVSTYTECVKKDFTLTDAKNTWTSYEFELTNVTPTSRIAIGTKGGDGSGHRMFIDDVVIRFKEYKTAAVPEVRLQGATSSTLSFWFSESEFLNAEADAMQPYNVALYRDAECTDLVVSWEIPANSDLYKLVQNSGKDNEVVHRPRPAFNFSGLKADTEYWCKVMDTSTWVESAPVSGKTKAFTVTVVGEAKAEVGGVVLAEDFSELVWGGDYVFPGISSKAKTVRNVDMTAAGGVNPTDLYKLVNSTTEDWLYGGDLKTAGTRLENWGHMGNNEESPRLYGRLGHVKVGTTSDWSRIVTPVLSNLEKPATVKVSFKASPYYDFDMEDSKDLLGACITVLDGGITRDEKGRISASEERMAKEFQLEDRKNEWTEYSYDIRNVTPTSRISIGAVSEAGKKHRMYIDDVKITVVAYEDAPAPEVRLQGATSSTLSFQWSENGFTDMAADAAYPYEVALYKDADCTDLFVSWEIAADNELYTANSGAYRYQPAFNFSGLAANTTYWCKVKDMSTGKVSKAVSAKTAAFEPVAITEAKVAEGGIVLAEDFSELVWGNDWIHPGISARAKTPKGVDMTAATGVNPAAVYRLVNNTSDWLYGGDLKTAGTRLEDWAHITNSTSDPRIYGCLGYVKLGSAAHWSRIVTPVLSNLKEMATVRLRFKAAPYYDYDDASKMDDFELRVTVLNGTSRSEDKGMVTAEDERSVDLDFELDTEKNIWTEYECEIRNVAPESRISIGAVNKSGRRMNIDDIRIEVVRYEADPAPEVRLQGATSSTLSFQWSKNGFDDMLADAETPYEVALYKDAACTDLYVSWKIAAEHELYTANSGAYRYQPAFNFSGLAANTTYWCKVKDTVTGKESAALSATTAAFEPVVITDSKVSEGGVVLAEDFSKLVWGGDFIYPGLSSKAKTVKNVDMTAATGENPTDVYKLVNSTTEDWLYGGDLKTAGTRLENWGHMGNNETSPRLYGRLGYVKVGTSSDWSRIVTPVLSNLSETATVRVRFKAAPFYDYDDASKMDGFEPCVTVLNGTSRSEDKGRVTAVDELFADLDGLELNTTKNAWTEYECVVRNVTPASRISIGSVNKGARRMNIDDIRIEVVRYEADPAPEVRLQGATSSTLSFQWSKNGFTDMAADAAASYKVALYKDAACTDLFVSWDISADNELYTANNGAYRYQPAFNFSGLAANTTYWCKVKDTSTGKESVALSATTAAFEPVVISGAKVSEGGIVLAEDFSELVWGGDFIYPGISSKAKTVKNVDMTAATGENPTDVYKLVNSTTEDWLYGGDLKTAGTRLENWGHMGNNETSPRLYGRLGYVKVGTSSDWSRIVTPVLSNLSETATVRVRFKAAPFYDYDDASKMDGFEPCVTVLNGTSRSEDKGRVTAMDEHFADLDGLELNTTKNAWTEYECVVRNVTPASRISIGSVNKGARRMNIDDIRIEVVRYEADPVPVVVLQGATSSSLSFKWSEHGFNDIESDYAHSYRVTLYEDAACTDLVLAWNIGDNTKFKIGDNQLQPAFNFAGLAANTSYWCRVADTATGVISAPVEGKTTAFPAVGALLAEDFSELVNGGGLVYPGASVQKPKDFTPATGDNPTGFSLINGGTDNNLFNTSNLGNAVNASARLKDWGSIGSDSGNSLSVYARLDAVKVGTGSRGGMIVTPELAGLGAKTATVKVSFKASPYYNNDLQSAMDGLSASVVVYQNSTMSGHKVTGTKADSEKVTLKDEKNVWNTYECTLENVSATDRIAIGMDGTKTDGRNNYRMFIDEIVITVVSYNE